MSLEASVVPIACRGKIDVFALNLSLLATRLLPCGDRESLPGRVRTDRREAWHGTAEVTPSWVITLIRWQPNSLSLYSALQSLVAEASTYSKVPGEQRLKLPINSSWDSVPRHPGLLPMPNFVQAVGADSSSQNRPLGAYKRNYIHTRASAKTHGNMNSVLSKITTHYQV